MTTVAGFKNDTHGSWSCFIFLFKSEMMIQEKIKK